ncbi:hypothetical protein Pen02_54260 [Plantactinospora endophytica]|uniref:Secreted protein n=1 Tax=Plantactinospora endophytica TaxID=673535 RepID=A0ABQ4E6Z7_9ACTN|nr:hypothetical protein [Plantactinospora endophytica]GIG90490.1 hypothetical protein Pen02_54260 [Plantactinospora endophytica]
MRRKLLSIVTAALIGVLATVSGAVSPASAGTGAAGAYDWVNQLPWPAVPPPGYVAPDGFTTVTPTNCYFSYVGTRDYLTGGYTECMRQVGVHRAAALCADGTIEYSLAEEMDYWLQSRVECGRPWPWPPVYERAVAAWGEYILADW